MPSLELKIFLFYDYKEGNSMESNKTRFYNKVRTLIIKEKHMTKGEYGYEIFVEKWKNFSNIYDFRGPDMFGFL